MIFQTKLAIIGDLYLNLLHEKPKGVIITVIFVTIALSTGLYNLRLSLAITEQYIPYNAPYHQESRRLDEFHADPDGNATDEDPTDTKMQDMSFSIFIESVGSDHDLTLESAIAEIKTFEDELLKGLVLRHNDTNFTAEQLFGSEIGETNDIPLFILDILSDKENQNVSGFELTYPVIKLAGNQLSISWCFSEVTVDDNLVISKIKILDLKFPNRVSQQLVRVSIEYQQLVTDYILKWNGRSREHKMRALFNSQYMQDKEVLRVPLAAAPYVGLTMATVCIFAVCITYSRHSLYNRCGETICSLMATICSIVATFGLFFHLGLEFNALMVMCPFLLIAVGIDDAFILLAAWNQTAEATTQTITTDPSHAFAESSANVKFRLKHMFVESGSAILFTSMTNAAAFGVGILSPSPALSLFCLVNSMGIVLDFLYQVTLFPAVLVLFARRGHKLQGERGTTMFKKHHSHWKGNGVVEMYTRCVVYNWKFQLFTAVLYITYISLALYGCTLSKLTFTFSKMFLNDSTVGEWLKLLETKTIKTQVVQFLVFDPPKPYDTIATNDLYKLIEQIEIMPFSLGRTGTEFWLRDFDQYSKYIDFDRAEYFEQVKLFLNLKAYTKWNDDIRWNKSVDGGTGDAIARYKFRMTVVNLNSWAQYSKMVHETRRIIDAHKSVLNASMSLLTAQHVDMLDSMGDSSLRSIGSALCAMLFVSALFLARLDAVLVVFSALMSILIGVIGLLALTGTDMDPFSVTDIVMSIGFSIDYAAHFCHHLYHAVDNDKGAAVGYTLSVICWPLLQCGLSTLIATLPLVFIPAYIAVVLCKTVCLVVILGLVHSLLFLPVFMHSFTR